MDILIRNATFSDYDSVEVIMKEVHKIHVNYRPDIYKLTNTVFL